MIRAKQRRYFVGIAFIWTLNLVIGGVGGKPGCLQLFKADKEGFSVTCQRVLTKVLVEIVCPEDDWQRFPDIKVNCSSVEQTKFINCSYPQNQSLLDIFRTMNIDYSRKINFENLPHPPRRHHFQNLSVSQLTFAKSHLTNMSFDMLYDVLNLRNLTIRETNLLRIPDNFFHDWSRNLRRVDFVYTKLRKIAKDDFAELANLWELMLYGNEIREIESGAFDHLTSLTILEISKNNLRTLPSDVFRHLTRLERLNLGQNPFDTLPDALLTGIGNCHLNDFRMNVIGGSLRTLPDGFFKNLPFLRDVQLQGDQLERLPSDLFAETSELVNLNLRNNSLSTLPSGFFNSFRKLRNLDLAKNRITTLPPGIFEELVYLDDLDISYNNFTTLSSDVLRGLGALTQLNASHNNLTKVDDNLCNSLTSVTVIDFSFNRLTFQASTTYLNVEHPSIFMSCNSLRSIYLSHNEATRLFFDFEKNEYIDLRSNRLTELTAKDIDNLKAVETLDLRNNQISRINLTDLPSAVANYIANGNKLSYRTMTVMLTDNPLHCDCQLIDFVRYWKSESNSTFRQFVKLTANLVNNENGGVIRCASPEELKNRDVSSLRPEQLNCPMKTDVSEDACANTCACRVYPGKRVLTVNCSRRNFNQLPSLISNAHNWAIELNMSHNGLTQTPSLQSPHLANVRILDLSNNNISKVTMDVFSANLVDLKLHNNSISRLDQAVVKHLENDNALRAITLDNNPWLCDCESLSFLNLIQKKTSTYRLDGVACYATNKKFYKMIVSDVCKDAMALIVGSCILIAFFGVAIGVLAAFYYKNQQRIKIWLYARQWCLWFVTEDELDKDKKYDAFVSFSQRDEDFVENEIVAKLEDGPRPYKLCLHYRDWLAGEWIPYQISQSVEDSRRTIIVLSANFLDSVWAKVEFRTAHTQALKEGRCRLIIVIYGEIENLDDIEPELKAYVHQNTYLKWGDPWFWDKLRYALPHKYEPSRRRTRHFRTIDDDVTRPSVNNDTVDAVAKSDIISMSKLANESAKLLDSGNDETTTTTC